MPLLEGAIIGVLLIGFSRPQACLPTEYNLLRAIADRSAMAIDRAGMTDALREREMRIAELSGHLMHAQEEERKRISRELHDETGQALMVIRLYLGMLEGSVTARTARKAKIRETLDVVDRTIEGIRRIIAPAFAAGLAGAGPDRRCPQGGQRSGQQRGRESEGHRARRSLAACPPPLRRRFTAWCRRRCTTSPSMPNATTVNIEMKRDGDLVHLSIDDDGVGIAPKPNPGRQTFGMAGMRERIGNIGGKVKVSSARGKGTRIEVNAPVSNEGGGRCAVGRQAGMVARGASGHFGCVSSWRKMVRSCSV